MIEGPRAPVSKEQIDNAGDAAIEALQNNQAKLTSGALSTAATVTEIVTGALLVLFTLIFFLHGGRNIWRSSPRSSRRTCRSGSAKPAGPASDR